jgi:hypothetical protein
MLKKIVLSFGLVTSCVLETASHFGRTYRLHLHDRNLSQSGKFQKQTKSFAFKPDVFLRNVGLRTTRRHNPGDPTRHGYRCDDLKSDFIPILAAGIKINGTVPDGCSRNELSLISDLHKLYASVTKPGPRGGRLL